MKPILIVAPDAPDLAFCCPADLTIAVVDLEVAEEAVTGWPRNDSEGRRREYDLNGITAGGIAQGAEGLGDAARASDG